jgi:hypothetical protein
MMLIKTKPAAEHPKALLKVIQPLDAYSASQDQDKFAVLSSHPTIEIEHYLIQAEAMQSMTHVSGPYFHVYGKKI